MAQDVSDIGSEAGLATRAARIALVLVWATGIAHGVLSGRFAVAGTGVGILAYAAALGGTLLVTSRRPGSLRPAAALALIGCTLTASLTVIAFVDVSGTPASEIWLLTFPTYLMALAVARGNPIAGTVGTASVISLVATWGFLTGQRPEGVIDMITPAISSLLVGHTWLIVLNVVVRRERRARSDTLQAAEAVLAAEEADRAFRRETAAILRMAEPSLESIAAGVSLDEDGVRTIAALEGAIRDRIRAPELQDPSLLDAVLLAREGGAHVLLLGSEDAATEPIGDALARELARRVSQDGAQTVTIRALGERGDGAASVVVVRQDGAADRVLLDADGQPVNGQISGT